MITISLTREEALNYIGSDKDMRPARIMAELEKHGLKNVQKFGRGKGIVFVAKREEETEEQCYYMFKEICIKEFGYSKTFDYHKTLEIINSHIKNTEEKRFTTLENISREIGISRVTLQKYRKNLVDKILKSKENCYKKVFGYNYNSKEQEEITEIYYESILSAFSNCKKHLYDNYPVSIKSEVALFRNKKNKSFEMIPRVKETFDVIKDSMQANGNKFIASYPVWFDVLTTKPYLNTYLTQRLFSLILSEYGYDYVFFRRLYEITEELKYDKELLEVINKAISFKNKLTNNK